MSLFWVSLDLCEVQLSSIRIMSLSLKHSVFLIKVSKPSKYCKNAVEFILPFRIAEKDSPFEIIDEIKLIEFVNFMFLISHALPLSSHEYNFIVFLEKVDSSTLMITGDDFNSVANLALNNLCSSIVLFSS